MRLGTPARDFEDFAACHLILIAVPDDAIAGVARQLAGASFPFRGKVVLHTSGARDSGALAPLRGRGAAVGSLHPLQTFGRRALSLAGVFFAIEGDEAAMRLARSLVADWGGKLLRLRPDRKLLYHAAATFASPLVMPLLEAAVLAMAGAGVPRKRAVQALQPLVATTLENFARLGRRSWTGPLARGDAGTVRGHLESLASCHPDLEQYYRASALAALKLLGRHRELRQVLEEEAKSSG